MRSSNSQKHTAPSSSSGKFFAASHDEDDDDLRRTMQPMERIAQLSSERKIPETTFGVTFAVGTVNKKNVPVASAVDLAELEIVKAILNREAYLERLYSIVKTISKKVKPEFAEVLELVRLSTLETIGAIVRWREAKINHKAPYLWNGMNYLLRTSSDLDYLGDYRALRIHMGFTLQRNPFSIAAPMEDGTKQFRTRVIDVKIADESQLIIPGSRIVHEVAVGGITFATLKLHYTVEFKEKLKVGNVVVIKPLTGIPLMHPGIHPLSSPPLLLSSPLFPLSQGMTILLLYYYVFTFSPLLSSNLNRIQRLWRIKKLH